MQAMVSQGDVAARTVEHYPCRPSWLRPATEPLSGVTPLRRYFPLYRLRRRSLANGSSLGLGPTEHLLG